MMDEETPHDPWHWLGRQLGRAVVLAVLAWLVTIVWILAGLLSPARAATCATADAVERVLEGDYAERLGGAGLINGSAVLELWLSADGTFSAVILRADGIRCIVVAGTHWQAVAPAPPGERH